MLLGAQQFRSKEDNQALNRTLIECICKVRYLLEYEAWNNDTRAHASSLWKIRNKVRECGDPEMGVFPDSLGILDKILDV